MGAFCAQGIAGRRTTISFSMGIFAGRMASGRGWMRVAPVVVIVMVMAVPMGISNLGSKDQSLAFPNGQVLKAGANPVHASTKGPGTKASSQDSPIPLIGLRSKGSEPRSPIAPTQFAPNSWEAVGPTHIPNATGILGLDASGKLQTIAVDPSNPLVMYSGGGEGPGNSGPDSSAGIYRTIDGGTSWIPVDHGITDFRISSLWVDPSDPSILVAGTWFQGIYRSVDAGGNWTLVDSPQGSCPGVPCAHVSSLLEVNGTLYAATALGVMASNSAGINWTLIHTTTSPVSSLTFGGGDLLAGTDAGTVLEWTGMKGNWTTILNVSGYFVWSVAVNDSNPLDVFVVEFLDYNAPNLYTTTNGGASWSKQASPNGAASQYVYLTNASSPQLYLGVDGEVYLSNNTGTSFVALPLHVDVRLIAELPNGTLVVGSDQGLFESPNHGFSWRSLSASIHNALLGSVAARGSTYLDSIQDFSPVASFDAGKKWNQVWTGGPVGEAGTAYVNPKDSRFWYAYTIAGYQYSNDGGQSFKMDSGISGPPQGPQPIAVDSNDSQTVYVGTQGGVYVSHDGGITFANTTWPFVRVSVIAVSPVSNQTIFVGTQLQPGQGALYRTTNGGSNWTALDPSLMPSIGFPTALAIDPRNSSTLVLGSDIGAGLWLSTNGGLSFKPDNSGVLNGHWWGITMALSYEPNSSLVAAGTDSGVYVSDGGNGWSQLADNLTANVATGVAWEGPYLFASTEGEGLVRTTTPVTLVSAFPVLFDENGLPLGTTWSATLNGTTSVSMNTTISFTEPNGTYAFAVGLVPGYTANVTSGNVTVNGRGRMVSISFTSSTGPSITSFTATPSTVSLGQPSTLSVNASGGVKPYSYSYYGLPPGCRTANSTPIVCTPTVTGTFMIGANVTDSNGNLATGHTNLTVLPAQNCTLYSVNVTPTSAVLPVGSNITFTALANNGSPLIMGVPNCPAGHFSWSLSNDLGTLVTLPSACYTNCEVEFVAGRILGTVDIYANASYAGQSMTSAPASITIVAATPVLSATNVTPAIRSMQTNGTAMFAANATCAGVPCPSGINYSWSLSNNLALLNVSTGNAVKLTAGSRVGTVTLYVSATLNGITKEASATITIISTPVPALSSVSISPSSLTVTVGAAQTFTASPFCNGGTCPTGLVYAWTLSNTLGNLSSRSGSSTEFTAGTKVGTSTLHLEVSLYIGNEWENASSAAVITIHAKPSGAPGFLGFSGDAGYILIGVIVAAVATAAAVLLKRGRGRRPVAASSSKEEPENETSEEAEPGKEG